MTKTEFKTHYRYFRMTRKHDDFIYKFYDQSDVLKTRAFYVSKFKTISIKKIIAFYPL